MATLEQQAINNGWEEAGIGFLIHAQTDKSLFLDFNGGDGDAYIVMKDGCNEVWDVLFTYEELAAKYIK